MRCATKKLPTQARLRELFDYVPRTGRLTRRVRAGEVAGSMNSSGYLHVGVDGIRYLMHRIIWVWMKGHLPEGMEIDHDDGVCYNNRWDNLYLVTCRGNTMNCAQRVNNTSGVTGVHRIKASGRWLAQIGVRGRVINLGHFRAFSDAVAARNAAEEHYGFHELHGRR